MSSSAPISATDLVEIAGQVPRARSYAASKPDNAWASRYVYDVPRLVAEVEQLQAEILALRQIVRTGRWDEPEAVDGDVHSLRREVYENLRMIKRLAAENKVLLQRLQQAGV